MHNKRVKLLEHVSKSLTNKSVILRKGKNIVITKKKEKAGRKKKKNEMLGFKPFVR